MATQTIQDIIAKIKIDHKDALDAYHELQKEIDKTEKLLERTTKGTPKYSELTQQLKALKNTQREYQKAIQDNVRENRNMEGSLEQLKAKLSQLTQEYNKLDRKSRDGAAGRKIAQQIKDVTLELTKAEQALGNYRRNVGNYMSGLQKFGHSLATGITQSIRSFISPLVLATQALAAFGRAVKQTIQINAEFEQKNADLAAILGTTRKEIIDMTASARLLGQTTIFSASQVTELQTELAKLGFHKEEILNSQEAVLKLAQATGANLADAASMAGATMRSFGLQATDMERIVSTLAVSTTKSALTFDKLATAMPIVGSVAKSSGFALEDTVALLGKLSDSGMDATMAATATRNILLNLANSSGKLAKKLGEPIKSIDDLAPALQKLKEQNISLAEAFSLTDKRSVNAFTIFVEQSDKLKGMRDEITDVGDELDAMVKEKMSTLSASAKILNAEWEEFMLTFETGNGVLKDTVDLLSKIVHWMAEITRNETQKSNRRIEEGFQERKKEYTDVDELYKSELKALETNDAINEKYTRDIADQNVVLKEKQKELAEINAELDFSNKQQVIAAQERAKAQGKVFRNISKDIKERENELKKRQEELEDEIKQTRLIIARDEEMLKRSKDDDKEESPFDPDAEKKAKKAEQAWKKALAEYYRLLKTTEEESIQMWEMQYDRAIKTATEIYNALKHKGENLTEEEELTMQEAAQRIFALENQKQRKADELRNKYLDKYVKRRIDEINNADAEELNSFFTTEQRKTQIAIEQAEQRKKVYETELGQLQMDLANAEESLNALLSVPESEQDANAISQLQILVNDLYDKILKTQAYISQEQGNIDVATYNGIAKQMAFELNLAGQTSAEKYRIEQEYLAKELAAVKGNSEKERDIERQIYESKLRYNAQQLAYELNVAGQTYAERYRIKQEYLAKEFELVKGNAEKERDVEMRQFEARKEFLNAIHDEISNFAGKAQELLGGLFEIASNAEQRSLNEFKDGQDARKTALQERLDAGLICQEEYDNTVKQMDEELAQKELEIQIAEAKREKAQGIISAAINTALAIMKIWADVPKMDFGATTIALTALVSAIGAAQIAAIASQPLPRARRGMLIHGADHEHGGVLLEAEGGEAIINKKATKRYLPLLSRINQSTGGVPLYGQGGMVGSQFSQAMSGATIDYNELARACARMNIQVAVTDINRGQAKMAKVVLRKIY